MKDHRLGLDHYQNGHQKDEKIVQHPRKANNNAQNKP